MFGHLWSHAATGYCLSYPRDAGVWTDQEAYRLYREKLVRLRELYMGQLAHLKHAMQERRRRFLMEWQAAGGTRAEGEQK